MQYDDFSEEQAQFEEFLDNAALFLLQSPGINYENVVKDVLLSAVSQNLGGSVDGQPHATQETFRTLLPHLHLDQPDADVVRQK